MTASQSRPNSRRILEEVVSLEAWQTPFTPEGGVASVHVDVVFLEARLGQEKQSPIRFKLKLRRADIILVVPSTEPLKILQESVARDQSVKDGRLKSAKSVSSDIAAGASANLKLSHKPLANMEFDASSKVSIEEKSVIEVDTPVRLILTTQSRTPEGYYRWEVRPTRGDFLEGKPWDAILEPRLSIRDARLDAKYLEGGCRVEVRCKREDLLIEEITLKDPSLLQKLVGQSSYHNKIAAAEAYIRAALTTRELPSPDMNEPFADVYLADVIVEQAVR